jgi:hypothetical protein
VKESLLAKTAPDAKGMIKEAVIGALAGMGIKAMSRVGKVLVKRPMMSLTAAGAGVDMASSASKMNDLTSGAKNLVRSAVTNPASM